MRQASRRSGAAPVLGSTLPRDAAGRITGYSHTNNGATVAGLDQSFGYDNLNRLLNATLASTTTQYSYDASGNRTAKVVGATTYTNTISDTSNRLVQTQDLGGTASIQYDLAGNVTGDGSNSFTYSDRGRMQSASNAGGMVNYLYNAAGQRVAKTGPTALVPTGAAYFVYDDRGQLLGEYDANNKPIYETIYLGSMPVGVIKQTGSAATGDIAVSLYNLHADHLATPRVITRQSDQAIVWRWDTSEAFGATAANQDPSGLGTFVFNQRFPGQVFDAETGLLQNWNREYDARQGRYRQSDPIGLGGGINTYAYANGAPLMLADPMGLKGGDHPSEAMCIAMGNNPLSCKQVPPSVPPPTQMCSCKSPSFGVHAQAAVGASIQAFIGGVSGSIGGAVSSSGQICTVRTVCGRVGPGFYAGAGGIVGVGGVNGNTDSLGGLSVGIGGDIGFGASEGGQVSMGVNPGPSVSSVAVVKGKGGGGYGMGAGLDICYSFVDCTSPCDE